MSKHDNDPVEVICKVERDEPGSLSIAVSDGTEQEYSYNGRTRTRLKWFWIPRKSIIDRVDHEDGSTSLAIPVWLAEDRGLDSSVPA